MCTVTSAKEEIQQDSHGWSWKEDVSWMVLTFLTACAFH